MLRIPQDVFMELEKHLFDGPLCFVRCLFSIRVCVWGFHFPTNLYTSLGKHRHEQRWKPHGMLLIILHWDSVTFQMSKLHKSHIRRFTYFQNCELSHHQFASFPRLSLRTLVSAQVPSCPPRGGLVQGWGSVCWGVGGPLNGRCKPPSGRCKPPERKMRTTQAEDA